MKTAIIGVGNAMRGDDGVGLAVIDKLTGRVPNEVHLVRNNGDITGLMDAWSGVDRALLIDAVVSDDEAGTVHRVDGRHGLPSGWRSTSSHLVSVAEAVDLSSTLHSLPAELTVIGITAATTYHGDRLSAPVAEAADEVADWVLTQVLPKDSGNTDA